MAITSDARPLSGPLVWVAVFLIAVPMVNVGPALWPVSVGEAQWRFGSLGLVLTAMFYPVLGIACLFGAGVLREDARMVRWVGRLAAVLAVILVLLLVVFLIDGMSLAGRGEDQAPRAFWAAVVRAVGIVMLSAAALGGIAIGARRSSAGIGDEGAVKRGGLVVGR